MRHPRPEAVLQSLPAAGPEELNEFFKTPSGPGAAEGLAADGVPQVALRRLRQTAERNALLRRGRELKQRRREWKRPSLSRKEEAKEPERGPK